MSGFFLVIVLTLFVIGGGLYLVMIAGQGNSAESEVSDSSNNNINEIDDPDKLIARAKQFESNHQWGEALKAWSRLTDISPDRTEAYFRRGLAAYRCEEYQQAADDFQTVIDEEEDPPVQIYLQTGRTHLQLDRKQQAYAYYKEYVEQGDPDPQVTKELADLAYSLEKWSQARRYYEHLKENAPDQTMVNDASLRLAEMALTRDITDRVNSELSRLEEQFENGELTDRQELNFWYIKAKVHESKDELEKSDQLYRKIYQRDSSFRDVKEIVEEQISNLDADSLVKKFQRMDQTSFEDLCQRIVEGMGYQVVESEFVTPEELDILAREKSMSLSVTRILFGFKQWSETAGELAIKEFEFKLVENRYDRGNFVNPAGYNSAAQNYSRGNDKINLMGAEEILTYLKDWYKE